MSTRIPEAMFVGVIAALSMVAVVATYSALSGPTAGLTRDQRRRAFAMVRAAQPGADARLRAAATRISRDRLRRVNGPGATIVAALVAVLAAVWLVQDGQYGAALLAVVILAVLPFFVRKTRHDREEARAYLAAAEETAP